MLLAIGAGLLVAGAVGAGVYWIRRALRDRVALEQRGASLQAESDRVRAMETAAASARAERAEEFDAKAARVGGASDAASLLRDVTGAGKSAP